MPSSWNPSYKGIQSRKEAFLNRALYDSKWSMLLVSNDFQIPRVCNSSENKRVLIWENHLHCGNKLNWGIQRHLVLQYDLIVFGQFSYFAKNLFLQRSSVSTRISQWLFPSIACWVCTKKKESFWSLRSFRENLRLMLKEALSNPFPFSWKKFLL